MSRTHVFHNKIPTESTQCYILIDKIVLSEYCVS